MLSIGAEHESEEIALVSLQRKSRIGKVSHFVALQIEDADGLHAERVLAAKAIVQKSGIAAVRAESNCCGKVIRAGNASGDGGGEHLAGRQRCGPLSGFWGLSEHGACEKADKKNQGECVAGKVKHETLRRKTVWEVNEVRLIEVKGDGQR